MCLASQRLDVPGWAPTQRREGGWRRGGWEGEWAWYKVNKQNNQHRDHTHRCAWRIKPGIVDLFWKDEKVWPYWRCVIKSSEVFKVSKDLHHFYHTPTLYLSLSNQDVSSQMFLSHLCSVIMAPTLWNHYSKLNTYFFFCKLPWSWCLITANRKVTKITSLFLL